MAPLSGPEKQRSPWSLQGGLLGRSAASSSPDWPVKGVVMGKPGVAQASQGPGVVAAQQNTAPYLEGLHDVALLLCFACLCFLENELRNFFYPRLQVRLVMKGLCRAQGALGKEHCHLQGFLLKMACSMPKKEKEDILREDRNCPGHCEAVWDSWLLIVAAKHLSITHNPVRPLDSSVSRRLRKTSVRPMFPNPHKIVLLQRAWRSMD